jgi:pyruvate/2-oxoglutarate dehydrogenase complex dihydrolipoamide dehydrogenase (E3) component
MMYDIVVLGIGQGGHQSAKETMTPLSKSKISEILLLSHEQYSMK